MSAVRLTLAEWRRIPESFALRHQIVDGLYYVHRPPTTLHQRVVQNVMFAFWTRVRSRGDVALPYVGVVLSETDAVIPDFTYIRAARRAIVTPELVEGAPDLIVEVSGDDTRHLDEVIKLDRYGRCGVGEYWIIDPEAETVKSFRLDGDRLMPARSSFEIPERELFEE